MSIRLSNVRVSIAAGETALPAEIAAALGVATSDVAEWRVLRKSLDLRDKRDLAFVYTLAVGVGDERVAAQRWIERVQQRSPRFQAAWFEEPELDWPPLGSESLSARPVIVGTGPAGLFAGLFLAEHGYQPILLERGRAVRERIADIRALETVGGPHDPESNYLFGEGGAGTFSDGKLTCRGSGPEFKRVLEIFAENKGKPSVVYEHRPHLGSNRLPAIVKALRRKIIASGGEFRFETRAEDLHFADGRIVGVATSAGYLSASVVVLAMGHSARDTFAMLVARGVPMVQKPFQFGVRIEQPQEQVNAVQYGSARVADQLGAADYTLVAHGSTDLFTFCMCAGGQVIPSVSAAGYFSTNGMSLSRRASPWANSGLMITLQPADFGATDVLAGVRLQQKYEALAYALSGAEYRCPIQDARDFLARRRTTRALATSYERGTVSTQLAELLPPVVIAALDTGLPLLDRRWRGKFLDSATLVGPEARGSSPVRLLRDPLTLQSPGIVGLYPTGEGAGYAGGIVSAAVDGLRAARAICARYAPLGN